MPAAWFIAPYKRRPDPSGRGRIIRYVAVDDFTTQVRADGGRWDAVEILGQRAIVKVVASARTLAEIGQAEGVVRVPLDRVDDTLADLTPTQRAALRQIALDCGYNAGEWGAAFPAGLADVTLRQVLRFLASRRRRVRYDAATDSILDDGDPLAVESVDALDTRVPDVAAVVRGR